MGRQRGPTEEQILAALLGQYINGSGSLGDHGHPTGHFPEPLVGTA